MECPQCGFDNRQDINFCEECGSKLELVCPSCRTTVPLGRKFCGGCGQNLIQPTQRLPQDLSFDEKLSKIQRYLPTGLAEKILAQRDRIEGERKHVTVMFCDMVGFTPLVEKLGPEDAYALMDQVQEILIHKVHEYEGTVNQLTGDGLMALFGAPIALEDAPQRAIRSSLSIHREMSRFSEKIRVESGFPAVKMRIGINTGPVVVGTVGNDLRVEFAAVGDTVNTASRVEGLAEPGTTYVTEETFKLSEGFFRFEGLGEKEIKGKEQLIKVYQVIAPTNRRTRFDVSAERGLTRFVGRERELELLLDGFERAKAGRGQAFSIVGEAGVGKSRLLYEFRKAVSNENVTLLEGKCLSYGRGVPYHPLIDVLKANFDIREEDGNPQIVDKMKNGLKILGADDAATLPYLLELLSVKDSGIGKIRMSPEGTKAMIVAALKRIVLKGSLIRPLIMGFEDLHWTDKSSDDVFKYLLEDIPGARVLLIFTYRPEFVSSWGAKSYHSQLNLNRLSNRESLVMMSHLLGRENIDVALEELILEKTEGVPFFIEEFVKSLQEFKLIDRKDDRYHLTRHIQEVTIPSTIQDVIMARVDSLPDGAKEVLQAGSVVEREFSYGLIKEVTSLAEQELLSHLSVLKESELLYERGVYPKSTYVFRHALTREVVYGSILTSKRKKLHEATGTAIERLHRDDIDQYYGVLTEHFLASDNYDKTSHYSQQGAKKSRRAGSLSDAIKYAELTVASMEKLPKTNEVQKKMIDARTALGLYYTQETYFAAAKDAVDPIVDLALKYGYRKRLCQIYSIMGSYHFFVSEQLPEAFKYLKNALRAAEEIGDTVSSVMANLWLGIGLSFNCDFEGGVCHFQKATEINEAANARWAVSSIQSNLSFFLHCFAGRPSLAYETAAQAMRVAQQSGDEYSNCQAYVSSGCAFYLMGQFEKSRECLLDGIGLSESINFIAWQSFGCQFLGEVLFELGQYESSIEHYDKAAHLWGQFGQFPSYVSLNKLGMALARVMNKELAIDLASLQRWVTENKFKVLEGWMRRYLGEILLNIDDQHISEAQPWIEQAIEADRRNGIRFHLARDYALYGELFKRKGDKVGAKEQLGKAIEIYKECGADGWVTKADEELMKLQ